MIAIDPDVFANEDVRVVTIDVMSKLNGRAQILQSVRSRSDTPQLEHAFVIYRDPDAPIASRIRFITPDGVHSRGPLLVENGFVFVFPLEDEVTPGE